MSILQAVPDDNHPMILNENQQGNAILEKLRLQAENEAFCDVVILVEDSKFNLHRNVLASVSPYFARLLQPCSISREKFTVSNQNAETFKYFVNYIYTGSIVIHKHNVNELLKLACRLEVEKLKMHCAEYLERNMDCSTCFKVISVADKYEIQNLSKQARIFIKSNMAEIINRQLLLELDVQDLNSFFSEPDIGLSSMQVFGLVLEWVRYDVTNRERLFQQVIKHVKCAEVDGRYLSDALENSPLFQTSELALYTMLKHLSDCGQLFDRFIVLFGDLSIKYDRGSLIEKQDEPSESIQKITPTTIERRKKKRFLRGNPLARLAALKSALLLRNRSRRKSRKMIRSRLPKITGLEEESGPLKCHLCPHYSSDTTALEQHLSGVHSREVTYKCSVCGYVCQWNNMYWDHVRGHFPGPPFKCDSCDFTCDKINTVMTHRSDHIEEKTLKCNQCSFKCRSQQTLQAHLKCHNSASSAPNDKRSNYVCDSCGFSTRFWSHLIAHKRIHSADLYRCSYPHCKFTTGKKTQLGSHAKSHQGVRPHCCQICGRGFLEKSHLVRHERIHLEEKPFKCHECDYASSRRDKLKEHQARHHGDHASAKVPYKARPTKKMYPESFSPNEANGRGQSGTGEMTEVLGQHHNLPLVNTNNYPLFASADAHHASSSAFHQQQLLSGGRTKEHRAVHQSTAAAVTAAMMLDPRFHHSSAGAGPYVPAVAQSGGQPGQQVTEYPNAALMSLF